MIGFMTLKLLRIITTLSALLLPQIAGAQINPCFLPGLPCLPGTGATGMANYLSGFILTGAKTAFLAVAIIFFFYYGIRLLFEGEDENTVTEVKSAYGYGIAGAAIVSLSSLFADSFSNPTLIINPVPIEGGLGLVILFMRLAVSISMSAAIVYMGVRLILLQGQESEIEEQKKRFFNGLLGVAIIILANTVVGAVFPSTLLGTVMGNSGSVTIASEIVGIINFILTLLGAMALLAFVIAGIMLIFAADDALKDRAKKTIFTTVVTLIIVFSSLLIIHFILAL